MVTLEFEEGEEEQTADVRPGEDNSVVFPGTVTAQLAAGGAVQDVVVTLVGSTDLNWPVTINPPKVQMEPGTEVPFTATVTVPEETSSSILGTLSVSGTAQAFPGAGAYRVEPIYGTIKIEQYYGLSLMCDEPDKKGHPGTQVGYDLGIENQGNGKDTFEVQVTNKDQLLQRDISVSLSQSLIEIEEKTTENITVSVNIPSSQTSISNYDINIEAKSLGGEQNQGFFIPMSYTLYLSVVSTSTPIITNYAPVIDDVVITPHPVPAGETCTIEVMAHDPEGDLLSFDFYIGEGTLTGITGSKVTWTAPLEEDEYMLQIRVADSKGALTEHYQDIEVIYKNYPPEIQLISVTPSSVANDGTGEILIIVETSDQNGIYDVKSVVADLSSIDGPASKNLNDRGRHGDGVADDGKYSLSIQIPSTVEAGVKIIGITVIDNLGETVSGTATVEVTASEKPKADDESGALPGFEAIGVILALGIIIVIQYFKRIH
ncbi:MAG: hypothetical protein JSV49_08625 [Thermoplasmata archaeon]|nr:MAG: hypothetical protein JSV49_08625 [Thermoplasmata archaeon]